MAMVREITVHCLSLLKIISNIILELPLLAYSKPTRPKKNKKKNSKTELNQIDIIKNYIWFGCV